MSVWNFPNCGIRLKSREKTVEYERREIEFDEELRGLNNKFMITQDEQKYILNKLNTTIEKNKST